MSSLPTRERFDLIIFDNDGTLVDSERLNIMAVAQVIEDAGLEGFTEERLFNDYSGQRYSNIIELISKETGFAFPKDMVQRMLKRVRELAPEHMKLIDGAGDVVSFAQSFADTYIVSNGEHQNLIASLEFANIAHLFPEEKIVSGRMSPNPKPAPDLFMMATEKAGVSPQRTLVIEDSITGVTGGLAANMTTWGFCGAHHEPQEHADILVGLGAEKAFLNMKALQKSLNE